MRTQLLILLSTMCTPAEKHSLDEGTWIDLTHEFSEETLFWPTASTFQMDTVFAGKTDSGYHYEAYEFSAAEHGGTPRFIFRKENALSISSASSS